jgi:hypothetical protein
LADKCLAKGYRSDVGLIFVSAAQRQLHQHHTVKTYAA